MKRKGGMFCREIKHKKKDKDDKTLKKHKTTHLNIFSSNKKLSLPGKHICFFLNFLLGFPPQVSSFYSIIVSERGLMHIAMHELSTLHHKKLTYKPGKNGMIMSVPRRKEEA